MKTCRACRKKFTPFNTLQVACSADCALRLARREKEKAQRAERKRLKARKEALKSKGEHVKEAQAAFNRFIRLRDEHAPCISCGRFHAGQYHAGHYRSVGSAPELRFEELNCHKQCAPCNNHLSGNLIEYRKRLIKKIGIEKVEWLEGHHGPKHYTIEQITQLKAHYRKLCREMQRQKAA